MRPDDNQLGRVGTPQAPQRSVVYTPPARDPQYRQQEAAANLIRSNLDAIYDNDPVHTETVPTQPTEATTIATTPAMSAQTDAAEQAQPSTPQHQTTTQVYDTNPYERTHEQVPEIQEDQWKQYHSAWQNYYQKYYQGYYQQQVSRVQAMLSKNSQPAEAAAPATEDTDLSRKAAIQELRQHLLAKVNESAKKIRKSRHFVPVVAALGVMLVFAFLQYNQVIVANVKAYVTPGNIAPQNIIVDPSKSVVVGPESRLIIPKINIDAPVFYDIGTDTKSQNQAMENGVAHFPIPGANSHPGEIGNTVLSAHSSNDVFAAGAYKYVFMQLDKLEVGDTVYANYNGTRYTYRVTKKEEVTPDQIGKLVYTTDKPVMTLITCTPLGTALRRLLVTAEQIYPSTTDAKPAPASSSATTEASIPGQGEPTLFERMFGG